MIIMIMIAGCHQINPVPQKPVIITTIYPYQLIISQLMDSTFIVKTLVPPEAKVQTWYPTPSELGDLKTAELIVSNGLGLEINLQKTLSEYQGKHLEVAKFAELRSVISSAQPVQKPNPHLWTNPDLIRIIVNGLSTELSLRYPMHKLRIEANASQLLADLSQTDKIIKSERKRFPQPSVVTLHDTFDYFFQYYKIEYLGAVQPSAGIETDSGQLQELAAKIKANQLKAIFFEAQSDPGSAQTLADKMGLKVIEYDDMGTTLNVENISGFLYKNWCRFKEGL
jgi:ABC-type Zn uptake system ZnuABC Zn-binding protein ZnuA